MPKRAFKFYQRKRVVNINVNVFLAGLLSIILAKYPIILISEYIGTEHKFKISVIAYVLDTTIDIALYFGLHWIANHWRPLEQSGIADKLTTPKDKRSKNFLLDVGRVQAERIALVPIFAFISMGGMWSLLHYTTFTTGWAFVTSFIAAMIVTRILHTIWGYQTGLFDQQHDHPEPNPAATDKAPH